MTKLHDDQPIDMEVLWQIADRLKGTRRPVSSLLEELDVDACPEWVTHMLVIADLDTCRQCSRWIVLSKGQCSAQGCA